MVEVIGQDPVDNVCFVLEQDGGVRRAGGAAVEAAGRICFAYAYAHCASPAAAAAAASTAAAASAQVHAPQ